MTASAQLAFDMRFGGGLDEALRRMVSGYRAERGVHDELMDATGALRPRWRTLLTALAEFGPEESRRRFDIADRHLADAGVVYRVYNDPTGAERAWPLAHLPMVVDEADWAVLAAGVVERANVLEALLADLYGPARLVSEGLVPAALVAGNSEYLRPMAGIRPAGGHWLHIYAADVSRGPDGRWWVLADKTQAPSGAGYAIENRIALDRAFNDLFFKSNVERLAGFYQRLRAGLAAASNRDEPRVALLSPGPLNETYFEHAYLARALGFLLVEGGDLTVRDDTVYIRTVEGNSRVDVLLRRLDADFADPLELNAASRIGVPGLAQAVRAGSVIVANALGSGLVEAPALLGFLPVLGRRLLGRDLALPNLATWWCGDPQTRRVVLDRFDTMTIAPAFGRTIAGTLDNAGVLGGELSADARAKLKAAIERRGLDFIGQEPIRLGTTPVWTDGRLVPRPYALRVFAARHGDGWTVMPGGFCRLSPRPDARALSMQRGGRSADAWVVATGTVDTANLVPTPEEVEVRRETAVLPSRTADNLFWLGRYLERADATFRLVRGLAGRSSDDAPFSQQGPEPETANETATASQRLADLLAAWGATPFGLEDPLEIVREALAGTSAGAVPMLVREARRTATVVRDRLSPDAWSALSDLVAAFPKSADDIREAEALEIAERGLRMIAAFSGLAHENMYRPAGWRFLDMGARIERAIAVGRFTRRMADQAARADCLGRLLDLTDVQVVYRARYISGAALKPVIDLVLLDEANPRSVAFQVDRLVEHLKQLAKRQEGSLTDPGERLALRLSTDLRTADPTDYDDERIASIETRLMQLSDAVTLRYFSEALVGEPDAEPEAEEMP